MKKIKTMELKEIAPYLAYELKCNLMGEATEESQYDENPIAKIFTITGISNIGTKEIEIGDVFIHADDCEYSHEVCMGDVFPILHPLSDLTLPCLEGGKIPIVELANNYRENEEWRVLSSKMFCLAVNKYGFVFDIDTNEISFSIDECAISNQLPFFNWLYEHHFWLGDQSRFGQDIIDINTLP